MNKQKQIVLLRWIGVLLLLLGNGLRLYHLDHADITGDEAWSVTVAGWPLPEVLSSEAEFNPPLYHLLLHVMMRLGGDTPFAIRYLSVFAGMLGVALVGRLGWRVGGRKLGTVALISAVLSPFLIYYAQEARFYSVVLVGSAASLLLLVRLLQAQTASRDIPARHWLLYGLASLVMLFSHYYGFAVMTAGAAFVVVLTLWRRNLRQLRPWIVTWFGMAALYLPWLAYSADFLGTRTYERFDQLTPAVWWDLASRTLAAYGAGITLTPGERWLAWAVVLLAAIGVVGLWRRLPSRRWLATLPPFIVLGAISFAWGMNPILPFFYERYLLLAMPAFLLLASAGLLLLARLHRAAGMIGLLLLLAAAVVPLGHHYFDPDFVKGGYGRLMADIRQQAAPNDLILLNNPLQTALASIYAPDDMPAIIIDRGELLNDASTDAYLEAVTAGYERVWLVEYGDPAEYDPMHRAQAWLGRQGSRATFQNYANGGLLYLFVLAEAAAGKARTIDANLDGQIMLQTASFAGSARPGDTLLLTLTWEALIRIEQAYTVFIHLIGPDGGIVAQIDGQPGGGANPTTGWAVGETVEDNHALLLPVDLPAGEYGLRAGMYLWPDLTRLPVLSAEQPVVEDAVVLGTVRVE